MRAFDAFYYSFSPKVAEMLMENPILQPLARAFLYPLVSSLRVMVTVFTFPSVVSEFTILLIGVTVSALIGTVHVAPFMILTKIVRRKDRDI